MNMRHNGQRRPEEIQAEIERTRHELDRTLSAIEQRLTPGQLVDQGLDYLKHSGAKQYVQHLGESAKRDPIPLALVGIGLAWLMMVDRTRTRAAQGAPSGAVVPWRPPTQREIDDELYDTDSRLADAGDLSGLEPSRRERASEAAQAVKDRAGDMGAAARERAARVADTASQMADSARDRVVHMADSARDMADSARARTRQAVDATRERAARVADGARHQAERVRHGYDRLVQEQPLALGALGFAIGALLGAAAPRTRPEDRLMGAASDHLGHEAGENFREPLHRAVEAAASAAGAGAGSYGAATASTGEQRSSDASSWTQPQSTSGEPTSLDAGASPGAAVSRETGTSEASLTASGRTSSASVQPGGRSMEAVEPRPMDVGPGTETWPPHGAPTTPAGTAAAQGAAGAEPPSYASGPEFEPGAARVSPSRPEDRADNPPAGR